MDKFNLSLKNQLILLTVILFVGVGLFWQNEIRDIISERGAILFEPTTPIFEEFPEEPVNIILPEATEQEETVFSEDRSESESSEQELVNPVIREEIILGKDELGRSEPAVQGEMIVAVQDKPTLAEIQEQIDTISSQILLVSQTAGRLAYKNGKEIEPKEPVCSKIESVRLIEIEQKITEISKQIESISEIIAQMNENNSAKESLERVAQI